jgi:hypothetical protein
MSNLMVKLAVTSLNGLGQRQGRSYSIERDAFDPMNGADVQKYGFNLLGDALTIPSRGLHRVPVAQLQELSLYLIKQATNAAFYVHNTASDSLYEQGHVYMYRSLMIPISAETETFVKEAPNNSMRLLQHAFPNDALELPVGTVARMREQMKSGARDGALFRALRGDATIKAYQQTQWDRQSSLVGDAMLGYNSIIMNTRHERFHVNHERYIVDIINPATREFHLLDGSSLWVRIVDTSAHWLMFAVIGTGKHRHALIDAVNNWGAMTIWHYLALVQQHLYEEAPSTCDEIPAHLSRVRQQSDPVVQKLYQDLCAGDTDSVGGFLRGLRKKKAYENGDGYL